uniref:NADH-ubiquinone oxidoreductase chain 4L n=1 Tax=Acanthaspis cincticrus TaxID=1911546 RepID=A0A343W8Q9_9HEMI|nr:NADH dehydrogenase subunit 4L [Acanthaspis cincticrus]AVZ00749.1 NADH dehydrogenase subunit 4L [Acanthaspis cincticrus]
MNFYDYYLIVLVFMIFSGLAVFCSMRKHLLLTLLSLEFLVLSLYFMFFVFLGFFGLSYYFILIFLTFAVCEGALGLGILVTMIRSCGSDSVMSLSILGW